MASNGSCGVGRERWGRREGWGRRKKWGRRER